MIFAMSIFTWRANHLTKKTHQFLALLLSSEMYYLRNEKDKR